MFNELTYGGIAFVILAWGTVGSLLVFCLIKVFSGETDLEKSAKMKMKKKDNKQ